MTSDSVYSDNTRSKNRRKIQSYHKSLDFGIAHIYNFIGQNIFQENQKNFNYQIFIFCLNFPYSTVIHSCMVKFVLNFRRKFLGIRKYRSYHQNLSDDPRTA